MIGIVDQMGVGGNYALGTRDIFGSECGLISGQKYAPYSQFQFGTNMIGNVDQIWGKSMLHIQFHFGTNLIGNVD